ncbi:hypothetical protein NEMIN01_0954 [Nematocida minor]|uniref:uncharacterized protein n=1 Tax=Nematocida minor TaxID=1912983 RepID=UPI00221E970F|nr:uncharacterized protein NEMIN01_0954 [Nematocida minor]KAI5190255.1 hypothetical protein NEMIN01_0954 [Nematocida minor]
MSDLPYYCHICSRVVYIEDRVVCPHCQESFLELHVEEVEEKEEDGGASSCVGNIFSFALFGCQKKTSTRNRARTITSDRRNYAIGPEIDDIISRLRDEKGVEENPATKEQIDLLKILALPVDEACTICFCPFEPGNKGYKYPCNHHFHIECSDAWLKLQSDCPLCRKSL